MIRVAVCIPSVPERDAICTQTMTAFLAQSGEGLDLRVSVRAIRGHTWGGGCNALAQELLAGDAQPDYLLFGCDDAVPRPGALAAALRFYRDLPAEGYTWGTQPLPGCRFYQDGAPLDPSYDARPHGVETPWCRLFLLPPAVYTSVGPLLDLTWYTDIDYCQRLNEAGHRILMCDGFSFDHLNPPRSWAVNGEVERQHRVYREACIAAGRSPLA
jgi:GT2 family glycosyltransferase